MKWHLAIVITICLLVLMLPACGDDDEQTATFTSTPTATTTISPTVVPTTTSLSPVKIGVVHDWTGAWAISGIYYVDRIIQLVDKQIKDQGGILGGREVKFLKYDAGSTLSGAVSGATKAFFEDNVSVLVAGGSNSVNGEAMANFAEENKILFVDYLILPMDISDLKYTIRSGYRVDEMDILAEYAVNVLNAKRAAIIGRDLDETRSYAARWEEIVEAAGGKTVYKDFVPLGATDLSPYITKIKYADPDVLLTDLTLDAYATLGKQLSELGGRGDMDVLASMAAAWQAGKPDFDGWYVYARWIPGLDNPASKKFEQDFQALFNSVPDGAFEMYYENFWVAIKAIELAGPDASREAIAAAARSGNLTWETPLGDVQWGTDGEPFPKIRLLTHVENGELVPVEIP